MTSPANPRWTPLHLELILHYRTKAGPFPQAAASAVVSYTKELLAHKLIEPANDKSGYASTARGDAFVEILCNTPLPVQKWVAPSP